MGSLNLEGWGSKQPWVKGSTLEAVTVHTQVGAHERGRGWGQGPDSRGPCFSLSQGMHAQTTVLCGSAQGLGKKGQCWPAQGSPQENPLMAGHGDRAEVGEWPGKLWACFGET